MSAKSTITEGIPVLYSFRRCPYAIRARLALRAAGITVELREVILRDKPASLLTLSTTGTVPVMQLADGTVLEQSYDILHWAALRGTIARVSDTDFALVWENDDAFKQALDRYKYADRYPEHEPRYYRQQGDVFLTRLERRLDDQPFLAGQTCGMLDLAIVPFVRQFAYVDKGWFDAAPYPRLQQWLADFLAGTLFTSVMMKSPPWQPGDEPAFL